MPKPWLNAINRDGKVVEFSVQWFEDDANRTWGGPHARWEILVRSANVDEAEDFVLEIANKLPEEQIVAMARAMLALM